MQNDFIQIKNIFLSISIASEQFSFPYEAKNHKQSDTNIILIIILQTQSGQR